MTVGRKLKIILFLLLWISQANLVLAQYPFERISKEQGLSHNNVESILEDSQGFMWIGTKDGLCRYDGYEIKVYRHQSARNSISGNRVLTLAEDNQMNLWVGTYQNGLNKFNTKKNIFKHFGSDYGIGDQVYKVKILKDGSVFVGSSNGLAIYKPKLDSFLIYLPSTSNLNSFLVSDILEAHDGKIYIASWENDIQLFDRNKGSFKSIHYNTLKRPVVNYRKHLLEDLDGNIWIAAQIHGLARYNPKTKKTKFYFKGKNELNTNILNGDMILSPEGNIWVATDGSGIDIFNTHTNSFQYIRQKEGQQNSLPSDHIYSLFIDKSNRVWVGTFDQGVAYYDPLVNKFENNILPKTITSFFHSKSVISLLQDSKQNLWIGTDGQGLHSIDKNLKLKSYYANINKENTISADVITGLAEDSQGKILIGTYAGGLSVYDPEVKKFRHYSYDVKINSSLHSKSVWTILCDSQKKNWLGLLGAGVDLYDSQKNTFKNLGPYSNEEIKVDYPNVMSLMEDSDGDIWFGTEGDGLFILDKQAKKILRLITNSKSNITTQGVIKALFQDSQSNIWIASEGSGLFKYNKADKSLKQFTKKDGLPGMIILGINEDDAGSIWVSTYDGLAVLKSHAEYFSSFTKEDGLNSNEFNAQAFIKLNNGLFLLGSNNGINIFDPISIRFNQNLPKIVFTKLSILNKEVHAGDTVNNRVVLNKSISYTREIDIQYSDKIFEIKFAALNASQAQKCLYKYKLEGFDEDWITTDYTHRFASYSNLSNGTYYFKVKASNNDGKWGNNTITLKINVLPPFWLSWWFIFLMILFFTSLFIVIYRYRMNLLHNKFISEQALNQTRILELEKENIESELEKLTYYTVNRNRVLINYKTRLHSLSVKAKESVKKGLQLVISEIDKEISDDKEWKYIEPRLDKFYNSFITKLREAHPDLSLSEIKIATYVRMNLSTKEIAEFMNKTNRAIENDRYRLRKKINLESNESLQNYLMNL